MRRCYTKDGKAETPPTDPLCVNTKTNVAQGWVERPRPPKLQRATASAEARRAKGEGGSDTHHVLKRRMMAFARGSTHPTTARRANHFGFSEVVSSPLRKNISV